MAHKPTSVSGKKLKLTLTILLRWEQAEKLTARAIRGRKNLAALVTEILEDVMEPPRQILAKLSLPASRW